MPLPAIIATAGLPALITGARAVVPHVAKRGLPALWSNAKKVFGPWGGRSGASKAASGAKKPRWGSGAWGATKKFGKMAMNPWLWGGLYLADSATNFSGGRPSQYAKDWRSDPWKTGLTTLGGLAGLRFGPKGLFGGKKLLAGLGLGGAGYGLGSLIEGGKKPTPFPQALAQGITSLAGNSENLQNTFSNIAGMYAQGKLMDALGFPQADQYTDMQLKNYLGSELLGSGFEQIPNIGLSSGMGSIGQFDQTSNTYADIINNPYKEQIKNDSGMAEITDQDIIEFLGKYGNKDSDLYDKNGKLKPESIRMLMLVQALQQPTNLPIRNAQTNIQARNAQARMDVQNQLGGKFKTIDPNQLYPTYAQPNVPINTPRMGYAAGGVANLINGGAANGPGTGTSDSIPARLSDGEFVMTAKAVKGAGNGSRAEGVRKMYELMNSLENA